MLYYILNVHFPFLPSVGPCTAVPRRRSSTESYDGPDPLVTKLEQLDHSKKMVQELESASKMMADMIGSLDTDFLSPTRCEELESSLDKKGMARSRTGSMSSSQPDITVFGTDEPPTTPPRDVHTPTHRSVGLKAIIRTTSEHSLVTQSLNLSKSEPSSPFHNVTRSKQVGTDSKRSKVMSMDRQSPIIKSKKQKKGGSMSEYYKRGSVPTVNVTASLNIASLQGNEVTKSPKKSKWEGLRSKINLKKKFKRSPSLDPEDLQGLQSRYSRKGSLISDSLMSTGINLPDGVVRQRRSSSSCGSSVALVGKIFAVLSYWQEHFFEVYTKNGQKE